MALEDARLNENATWRGKISRSVTLNMYELALCLTTLYVGKEMDMDSDRVQHGIYEYK